MIAYNKYFKKQRLSHKKTKSWKNYIYQILERTKSGFLR